MVSFGPDSFDKHITTCFRHTFQVPEPAALASLSLELLRDDGAIVYLNGVEAFRSNVPEGLVGFDTPALVPVSGAAEGTFFSAYLSTALLQPGDNVLAVEIHQSSGTSSDISFDLRLEGNTTFLPDAAALDRSGSVKGGPYSEGAFPGPGQFGLMTITDDGTSPICVDWSGRNEANTEIVAWSTCLASVPPFDKDGDGVRDVDDCAFADPDVWSSPDSVSGVRVEPLNPDDVSVSWSGQSASAGPATQYDVVAISLSALRADASFDAATCLAEAVSGTSVTDGSGAPPPGEGAAYLLRAVNACGTGGFGQTDASDPRFPLEGDRPCGLP